MKFRFIILMLSMVGLIYSVSLAQTRGGGFSETVQQAVTSLDYHALIIGINTYGNGIPQLDTSVNDARAIRDELLNKYGFPPSNVTTLFDGEATRSKLIATFRELAISLNENDALIIYYAGHGIEDPATSVGYWIPTDAKPNQYDTYIANSDIRNYLRAIKAKHIFLVSDSCFSGTLLAQRAMPGEIDDRFYAQKAQKRSRVVLTSGGNEPVSDAGRSGHSIFGYFFLQALRDYDKPYLIPTQIFAQVGPLVGNNASQTPQWGALREAMDEGGEVVLVNRRYEAPSILSFSCNKSSKVYLNGEYIGQTPIGSYQVKPGTYNYKLACPEFGMDRMGTVIISAGENKAIQEIFVSPVTQQQSPQAPGYLTVAIKPWAQVEIDGKNYGLSPLVEIALPSGPHTINLKNPKVGLDQTLHVFIESGGLVKIGPQPSQISK